MRNIIVDKPELTVDGHVREMFWNGKWNGADLTAQTNGPSTNGESALSGSFDGSTARVSYISAADGHVRELYFNGVWNGADLTVATSAPLVSITAGSPLTSFFDGNIEHVFYISYTSAVQDLRYSKGQWSDSNLKAGALPYGMTSFSTPH